MTTPPYNADQVLLRVYDAIKNCLRVCVTNTAADPVPVTVVSGTGNTTPAIANVACPVAGTEYNYVLPTDCRGFVLKARKGSKVDFAYVTAATEVLTVNAGFSYEDKNTYSSQTIYFKCSKTDETIEVVTFV